MSLILISLYLSLSLTLYSFSIELIKAGLRMKCTLLDTHVRRPSDIARPLPGALGSSALWRCPQSAGPGRRTHGEPSPYIMWPCGDGPLVRVVRWLLPLALW